MKMKNLRVILCSLLVLTLFSCEEEYGESPNQVLVNFEVPESNQRVSIRASVIELDNELALSSDQLKVSLVRDEATGRMVKFYSLSDEEVILRSPKNCNVPPCPPESPGKLPMAKYGLIFDGTCFRYGQIWDLPGGDTLFRYCSSCINMDICPPPGGALV